MNQNVFLDEAEEHDRWIFGRVCSGQNKIETFKGQKNRTLEMAKEECAKECNLVMECYYATLYYNETTTVEECTLVTKDCGDWVNYENQLDRYFYQKGISFKIYAVWVIFQVYFHSAFH